MRFARWVFAIAGIVGIILLVPMYLLENRIARNQPPAITHPEFYYGFVGVALAWQLMFLVIATDPARYRLGMLPAVVEKASFVIAIVALFTLGRVDGSVVGFAALDGLWMILFSVAYCITPKT